MPLGLYEAPDGWGQIYVAVVEIKSEGGGPARAPVGGKPRRGFVTHRLGKWIALSQYGFPFSIGNYSSPVGRFRALARRSRFASQGRLTRLLFAVTMTLSWPFGAFSTALRTTRHARGVRDYGLKQLRDMYWLALRHSIPPLEYALYRLDDPARRRDMHEYVYWNDLPGLSALNASRGADNRDVQDKDRFAEICAQHGFPHVDTLAVFDRGRQIFPNSPFVADAPVLWKKSLRFKVEGGGTKWIRDGDLYRDQDARTVPAADVAEEFRKEDCLVQPFVESHAAIAHVSNAALAALRIVTGMNEEGEAEYITAQMGLPHGAWTTSVSSIVCSVDADTGEIWQAAFPSGETVGSHPDTGASITGLILPFWAESVELVLHAHSAAFPRFAFLGWDVALTPGGPVLLETNSGWGAIFHQMLDGPLGHTAFSRLVGQYV